MSTQIVKKSSQSQSYFCVSNPAWMTKIQNGIFLNFMGVPLSAGLVTYMYILLPGREIKIVGPECLSWAPTGV